MAIPATFVSGWQAGRAARRTKSPRTPLVVRLAKLAGRVLPHWQTVRRVTLALSGFGMITAAAWMVAVPLGLLVGGLGLLFVEYLSSGG